MNLTVNIDQFRQRVDGFAPNMHPRERILALYSAAITLADDPAMSSAVSIARQYLLDRHALYEVVLQSYLFLGFPRMLIAAEHLDWQYKEGRRSSSLEPVSAEEASDWFQRGIDLCRRVYDGNYERLKQRVEAIAPEIFRWMVFEGYGKVLSRPGLDIFERELAIIACLTMENRPAQLHSHVRGALNVGADPALVRQVIDDIGPAAGDGYATALEICNRLKLV